MSHATMPATNTVLPPLPAGFSMPFYYASLSVDWFYYLVNPGALTSHLAGTGLDAALFEGRALVTLGFQRYTGHLSQFLSTVNEVEFNVIAYPSSQAARVPVLSVDEFLSGQDQTKLLGNLRLHVAADNAHAVQAGIELFGEPKFTTTFDYAVPDLNDPAQSSWQLQCNDPTDATQAIFALSADYTGLSLSPASASPVMGYTMFEGRLLACAWNLYGPVGVARVTNAASMKLTTGTSDHPMRTDIERIIGSAPCMAVQRFASAPVATQGRGFFVDAEAVI